MSGGFRAVQWNRYKLWYDGAVLLGIFAYIDVFLHIAPLLSQQDQRVDDQILLMRAFGSCAFILVTIILCIGPLARLDRGSCRCSTIAATSASSPAAWPSPMPRRC